MTHFIAISWSRRTPIVRRSVDCFALSVRLPFKLGATGEATCRSLNNDAICDFFRRPYNNVLDVSDA
jgi:hypothetical protein